MNLFSFICGWIASGTAAEPPPASDQLCIAIVGYNPRRNIIYRC